MGEQRVARIREMFVAFNRGGIEASLPYVTEDVVWHSFPEWPGEDRYEGQDGLRQLTAEWTENFDEYHWDVDEVIDHEDVIAVLAHHHGLSKTVGMPIRDKVGGVFSDFDAEDRPATAHFFLSWEKTLEAAEALEAARVDDEGEPAGPSE
jgi:ketosteroid isomerase-like protein